MAQGISDANYKAVYNSLRQQGYSHADAVREATGILAFGAAPEDPVFGTPESRVDGAPSEPLVMDAVVGQQDLGMPYPPMSYGQYRTARQRAERGLGPMPQDAFETDADIRARYDGKYGQGSYDADAPGRKWRSGIEPGPADAEGYGGFAAAMAEAETGMTRAQRIALAEEKAREWDRKKAEYDQATGLPPAGGSGLPGQDGSGRDWSNWSPGQPLPAMVSDMDRALAYDARKEQERDARLQPMLEANRRDMKARKDWADANPEEAANLREGAKERGDDYRKEQLLYRMAKATGKSIEQLRQENPEFGSVGGVRSGSIPSLQKTADGYEVGATPVSTSRMRDDAKQARLNAENERAAKWKAQTMLAGANPAKNAVNTFGLLTPEQQQDVISTRMKFPNREAGKGDEWDRRLDMMRLQMENDRTEREKDRNLTREARAAQDEAEQRRFSEDEKRRKQEWDKFVADQDLKMLGMKQSHETSTLGLQAQFEALRQQGVRGDAEATAKSDAQDHAKAMQDRAMEMKFMAERPGEYAVARGLQTPDADTVLKRLAAQSDRFQWLPGGGFGEREAGSMNASLIDLARQAELAGLNTRLNDRAYREELIRKYGYASGWSGGRGGWMGDWWQPIPADPTVAAQ